VAVLACLDVLQDVSHAVIATGIAAIGAILYRQRNGK